LAVFSLFLGQFVENNWAKPYFFSKYMDLHPLVVIFSFVIAAKFLGVVGVLIAPAIAAVLVTLFQEVYVRTMNEESEIIKND
jgi:predicted PurR-regulated permease PerM